MSKKSQNELQQNAKISKLFSGGGIDIKIRPKSMDLDPLHFPWNILSINYMAKIELAEESKTQYVLSLTCRVNGRE